MNDKLLNVREVVDLLGIGESTWWAGVASKRFPAPIKLGVRITRWRLSDLERVMNGQWRSDE